MVTFHYDTYDLIIQEDEATAKDTVKTRYWFKRYND